MSLGFTTALIRFNSSLASISQEQDQDSLLVRLEIWVLADSRDLSMLYSQTISFPNWGISLWAFKSSRHLFGSLRNSFHFPWRAPGFLHVWRFFSALLSMPSSFNGDYRTLWSIMTGFSSALLPCAPASLNPATALLLGKSHVGLREKLLISFSALISAFCVPHPHTWWRPAGKIERMVQACSVAEKPGHSKQSCQPTCSPPFKVR